MLIAHKEMTEWYERLLYTQRWNRTRRDERQMTQHWTTDWEYISTRAGHGTRSIYFPIYKFKSKISGIIVEVEVDRSALATSSKRGAICPESVAKDAAGEHLMERFPDHKKPAYLQRPELDERE